MNRLAPCLALLAACPAFAAEVVIQQVNLSFTPSSVTVNVGDTVKWVRTSGSHTVTSGSNCTASGFSAPLNSTSTSFTWVVPASTAGTTVPFFCSPHCSSGMKGTIIVRPPAIPGDFDGNGVVNGADLGTLLGAWNQPGPTDINGDGTTNGSDLGILLGNWTT